MDVSVIVPFYKGNKYINNVLKMLMDNAAIAVGISIEAVIVNDSPETDVVLDKSLIQGYELRTIRHSRNMGIQQARITGINEAKGTYILMLDQDDKIEAETIKSQFDAVEGLDAVVANGYNEDETGCKTILFKNSRKMEYVNDFSFYFYFGNIIASPGLCLMRKNALPRLWLTNIMTINGADDWLLWIAFLNHGNKFVINNTCLYTHVNDGSNTSNDNEKMIESSLEALDIARNSKEFDEKMLKIYARRLKMRLEYVTGSKAKKIMAYLKNLDIAFKLIQFKNA